MAAIFLGNLTCTAEREIRGWLPATARFFFNHELRAGIIELPDLPTAQELARQLDGCTLDGQTVSAIERTRLEAALAAARAHRSSPTLTALATRFGLSERESQLCLNRLVSLLGMTAVLQVAELAPDQDSLFSYLLRPFHPIVNHALRCGSLRQAESIRQPHLPHTCSPVLDPVEIENNRRKELVRQARRNVTRLEQTGITEGITLTRARAQLREAERALADFWERFDLFPVQPECDGWRPKPVAVQDNWEELQ